MKELINFPIYEGTLNEYTDAGEFSRWLKEQGCDGIEAIRCDPDERHIVPKESITGLHLKFYPAWIDFWNGNEKNLLHEFGARSVWEGFYGGADKNALLRQFEDELDYACSCGAEYVVFHISDVTIEGVFTHRNLHRDEEVIDASVELINTLLSGRSYQFTFLMENLWWPGLTMTRPDMTRRLLDGVKYEKKASCWTQDI